MPVSVSPTTTQAWPRHAPRGRRARLRQLARRALGVALAGGVAARVSYALGLHGTLSVSQHEVRLTRGQTLPAPLVLAFASDFHAGPATHPQLYARFMEELERQKPDVLLLGGDYVYRRAAHVERLASYLAHYTPPLGKYAVLGNHDVWNGPTHIARQLERAGVQVLVNRNVALPAPFSHVSVCGIDDPWLGSVDMGKAFAGARAVRIFLTHSPDGLRCSRGTRFDVGFAGHTHGGQIAFRDGTPVMPERSSYVRRYSRGRFDIQECGPLIVSRGVGCSHLPLRINADPELVLCTLRADDPAA